MVMTTVNTATLKQQLSHYLALARQGKDVLITSHKRIIARLMAEETGDRLPLREPTKPLSTLQELGGFGLSEDPLQSILKERETR